MTKKILKNAAIVSVPQNRDEASEAIAKLGNLNRELILIEAAMAEGMAGIKKIHEEQADPVRNKIVELTRGVQAYCEANRNELTRNGKVKFHQFPSGDVNWRTLPAKVNTKGVDAIIEALKKAHLERFIRTKLSIDKDAIAADADAVAEIKGITIGSEGENFSIEPHDEKLSEVA
ncbi:MAG: host-nuclease inhibitor Gam family protein [Rhizobiales bacterium]|nr:host-nuclease inhibitor Gam family protein [Hyphomicrobiales bacterium]